MEYTESESESDMENIDLVNFLSISSDSENDEQCLEIKKPRLNLVEGLTQKIAREQIKEKMSYKGAAKVAKLMNDMPNAAVKINLNRKTVKTCVNKPFEYKILLFCETCNDFVENETMCGTCKRAISKNSKQYNYMVYIPIESQIRQIINKHFDVIIDFSNRERSKSIISDVDDGQLFKAISHKHPNTTVLSFTMNADGANIFKSSHGSLWPVQLYFNNLPPHLRFSFDNIIVSTLYYGKKKPDMKTLLYPLAKEFDYLNKELISVYKSDDFYNFYPTIILCSCDLPARAEIQNMKGATGFDACGYCYHHGESIKNKSNSSTVRYIKLDNIPRRKHGQTIATASRVVAGTSIDGIKGQSALVMYNDLNVIDSCSIDYMHGVALGVFKDLLLIWLGMKNIANPTYPDHKIHTVKNRKLLNDRILMLKPNLTFNRKPRTIFEVKHFKASELLNCLWYYMRYVLIGLLPTRVIKHFEKLSAATYILCKKNIEIAEVNTACSMLIEFADEFENIYSPSAVTMNVHLLRHYYDMVLNCGPLWSHSLFGFENNIGKLKSYVCGTTDVLEQIVIKYLVDKNDGHISNCSEDSHNGCPQFFQAKLIKIDHRYAETLINAKIISSEHDSLQIWRRMKFGGQTYTSMEAIETKTIDYFVKIGNQKMGKIVFFFYNNSTACILLNTYDANFQNHHWLEITPNNSFEIHTCTEIKEKLLYFKACSIEYITQEPNAYGRSSF